MLILLILFSNDIYGEGLFMRFGRHAGLDKISRMILQSWSGVEGGQQNVTVVKGSSGYLDEVSPWQDGE
jgi:hypothetical protein